MNFAIGYQQPENGEPFPAIAADYRDALEEVYFPWVHAPSGRAPLGGNDSGDDRIQAVLEEDLAALRELGLKLDLLFNANCYGTDAMSPRLIDRTAAVIDHLGDVCGGPDIVTTTSLTIAHGIKTRYPEIETRASVNMRIGTTQAMSYVADLFDGFYLQRDRQRDIAYVRTVREWCAAHGKKLCLLANSGCLRYCPGQIFHDNAVAHDADVEDPCAFEDWDPHVCWNLYREPDRLVEFLRSTWLRPEDLARYDGLADVVKLATRQHSHPRMVIDAYVRGHYRGDLMNLMEPCFAPALAPFYIDNSAFPPDWAERITACGDNCESCRYCEQVLQQTLKRYDELE